MKLRTMMIGAGAVAMAGSVFAKEYTLKPKYNAGDKHVIEMSNDMKMNVMGQAMNMSIGK